MRLRQKTATFFAQLYKCLNSSKREVYSLSPSVVRPDVQKLRDAIDNALFLSERMKGVSVSSAASLKKMTHTASTIARVVYIPNNVDSATTRSSHHKLIRIRRFLTLASQVAAIMHGVLEKMLARGFNLQASEKVVDKENSKQKQEHKAELSMDELADLFMSKFNTSESVSCDYSRLSFRDPRKHELISPVVKKEQYPGTALQDGGVKFVLRESPLTQVLQQSKSESMEVAALPKIMPNAPQVEEMICDSRDKYTGIEMIESLTPFPHTSVAAKQNPTDLCFTDIVKSTTSSLNTLVSRAMMKQAGRRLPPNLSNVAAARISPGSGYNSASETEKYWRIVGANIEVIPTDITNLRLRLKKVKFLKSVS